VTSDPLREDHQGAFGRLRARSVLVRLGLIAGGIVVVPLALVWALMARMPGASARPPLPALTDDEARTAERLRADVVALCSNGERNLEHPDALLAATELIERSFSASGLAPVRHPLEVHGVVSFNVDAKVEGKTRPRDVFVVGAHYDSARGAPGANDNGSGVAALLELAARFARRPAAQTLRFVAFTNEEPPYFRQPKQMGSRVYARELLDAGVHVTGMISLETMGFVSDAPRSQRYPFPFSLYYPDQGNFIAFVGSYDSAAFIRNAVGLFRAHGSAPSQGGALPARLPGVGWSDHESFALEGTPALMVTDTAPFRYPHYHTAADTPDKVDYAQLARVVVGLAPVVEALASE
jgi:hypothetical protein